MTTQSKTDDGFLQALLRRVIKNERFPEDAAIHVKTLSQAGNGFIGINSTVEVRGKNKVLKLFAKAANKNESVRQQMYAELLFQREIYFYETVYPSFLKFQLDRNVQHPFNNIARYYLSSTEKYNETLIFEDLNEKGYVQYDKKQEMNAQTITFVFTLYARYHAVSYAMKDQEPELYAKLSKNLRGIIWDLFKSAGIDSVFARYSDEAVRLFDPKKDAHISKRIANLTHTLMEFFSKSEEPVDHSVISHGDCWFNNFLFKYKDANDQNTLEDIKVLDWQIIRVSSPVLDLSYFFYSIAAKTTLAQLDLFLKTYHRVLSESIKEMGSDPEELFPYSAFQAHWKKFSKYGLLMSLGVQRMLLADPKDVPNPVEFVEDGKKWGDAFEKGLPTSEAFERRMRDIIEHFVHNDFI